MPDHNEACYAISAAARLVKMHPQTLRYYERLGLIQPSRSRGKIRLYSPRDIERLLQIRRLVNDLGVNLAGVEVILRLTDRVAELERELVRQRQLFEAEIARLRQQLAERPAAPVEGEPLDIVEGEVRERPPGDM
jgi:MerR family transcriptional regulator/heat shock protein HspR